MPVKPENKALYPADWDAISRAAKERAGWRCQHPGCTARQYAVGFWWRNGSRWDWLELRPPAESYAQARQLAANENFTRHGDGPAADKIIVIVLTTAHLLHDPRDCSPEALAVLCQRHHLAHDARHHATTAYTTRMAKRGNLELPL